MREVILRSMTEAFEVLDRVGDAFFGVTFVKKDDTVREMNCRRGVKKHLKGGELKYSPRERNLLSVYDVQAEGYRMVNVETLLEIRHEGTRYLRGW